MSPKTNAHTSDAKQLLTLRDLHHVYSIAPSSAYRYMAAGQLRSIKVAGRRLVRREDVEAFIASFES
ncbi:MAG: Helix-turn-helix domain [Microvirga sp.]|jgi:predicted DNA-binding transcriptional regulator AlpA|nr:Helix-turn-helix domain [Microvirga sp.]